MSDRQLRKVITDLIKLERNCFASRSRFAFYDYLAAVFELYVQLRRTKHAKPSARRIAKLFCLPDQNCTHCIRAIIDATSMVNIKTRSRWTRALRYARGANAKYGKTLNRSCRKTVGLPVAPISLLQSTKGDGIRVASSTAAPKMVGLI
jgi:hypothetical protein